MKPTKLANLLMLGVILAVAGPGCRKRPTPLTILPGSRAGNPGDVGPGPAIADASKVNPPDLLSGIKSNDPTNHQGWIENAEMFKADKTEIQAMPPITNAKASNENEWT